MTPFEATLVGILASISWVMFSALIFWVTGSQWALLTVLCAFVPWSKMYLDEYGRKP